MIRAALLRGCLHLSTGPELDAAVTRGDRCTTCRAGRSSRSGLLGLDAGRSGRTLRLRGLGHGHGGPARRAEDDQSSDFAHGAIDVRGCSTNASSVVGVRACDETVLRNSLDGRYGTGRLDGFRASSSGSVNRRNRIAAGRDSAHPCCSVGSEGGPPCDLAGSSTGRSGQLCRRPNSSQAIVMRAASILRLPDLLRRDDRLPGRAGR